MAVWDTEIERRIILKGDTMGNVASKKARSLASKWDAEGVNENGEYLMDIGAKR